jgi:hypothetical protein
MPRISHPEQMLLGALNDLERDWQIATSDWRDRAREHFENEYVGELQPTGRTAATAMTELTLLLRRVVRECN